MLAESYIRGTISKYQNGCQRWPEKPLILGRSETQYVAMVTKLYYGAHLVESYCKKNQTFLIQIG